MKTDETGNASGIPNNLPPRPSPFVNREEEIQQAIGALLDSSVCAVALVGIAGIGKTSLAIEIAYRLLGKGEFTGGIIWLAARDLQSSADLAGKIAAVLGVSGSEVTSRLSSRRFLVVLDGLDELNPLYAPEVKRFLETFPAPSKVLVTSRLVSVLPLQAATIRVDAFSEKSGIELFNALGASKDTEVPYVERGRIAEIIRALGYHPLAVTLAVRLIQSRYAEAREVSQQLLGILDELVHESNRAAVLDTIAQIYFTLGDFDGAIQLYQQSLVTQEKLGDMHGMAQTFNSLGVMYVQKGEWDKATEFYRRSLAIEEQLGDVHGLAQTFGNLGAVYAQRGEWDKAIEFYQRSLAIKEQLGDVRGLAQTYNNLGLIYAGKGEWDKAIEFYQSSLATMEQLGDLHGMAQTYNNLGLVYADKGEWDKAIEFYQKALAIMERVGDSLGKSSALHNMAQIFVERGELDRAMQLYQQSLALKEQIGDLQGKSATLHQMAGIFVARGDLDRAMQLYQESLGTYERIGDLYSFALTLNNLGMMYRAKGNLETAYENISRSHEILGKLGVPQANSVLSVQAEIGYELGKLLVDQGRWYDALRLFEKSLTVRRQNDDLNARADTIYQIARVHHLMGNLDKARIHYRDALRLYQHIQNLQGVAACETGLGRLMIQMGFLDDAVRELDSAKQIYHQLCDDRRIAEVEEVLQVANHIKGETSRMSETDRIFNELATTLSRWGLHEIPFSESASSLRQSQLRDVFTGRTQELREVLTLFQGRERKRILVYGWVGIGKTAFILEVLSLNFAL
jgi:tetratricopeptide (TPR) repeat protein